MTNARHRLQEFIDGERFNLKPTDLREVLASLQAAEEVLRRIAESGAYHPLAVTSGNYDLTGWSKASDLRAIAAAALLQGADK